MATVTVYRVQRYSIMQDEVIMSKRMATRSGAQKMQATVIEGTGREIDDSELEFGEEWTRRDFGLPRL